MEYLKINVDGLQAANWELADGSAGSGIVNDAELTVQGGKEPITENLDWSGLTGAVTSFDVKRARSGPIGTAANPTQFDTTGTGSRFIRQGAQRDTWYHEAKGAADTCDRAICDSPEGGLSLIGGRFTEVEVNQGRFYANQATTIDGFVQWSGHSTIEANANPINSAEIRGGVCDLHRVATVIDVYGDAVLNIDIDDDSITMTVRTHGRRCTVNRIRGPVPTVVQNDGVVDLTRSQRDEGWGTSSHKRHPRSVLRWDQSQDLGTVEWLGGGVLDAGGAQPLP